MISNIVSFLSLELYGFSIGDFIISHVIEIGSGSLWLKIKEKMPKDNKSLDVQLYNVIENSIKNYSKSNNLDYIAPACELIYGLWVKNKGISEKEIKKALSLVNPHYIGKRNVQYWYRLFFEELIKEENITLYKWYILHASQNIEKQMEERVNKLLYEIEQMASKLSNAGKKTDDRRTTYQSQIRGLLFDSLPNMDFSLKDIYVSLHGILGYNNSLRNNHVGKPKKVVDTTEYIWSWYAQQNNLLLFLCGEPGSGKSSLLKTIASTKSNPEGLTLFINLYQISFSNRSSALETIEKYIDRRYPWFFDTSIEGKRLLILDGLDEIRNRVYESAEELVQELEICNWQISCAIIISGRTQIIKKSIKNVVGEVLEILPLFLDDSEIGKILSDCSDEKMLLMEDLRIICWRKLNLVFNLTQDMPLLNDTFNELSKSPLLLYLIVWTLKNEQITFDQINCTAELYEIVFRHVYTREYNHNSPETIYFNPIDFEEYHEILHYLGACAYRNNSRAVPIESIYDYCKIMNKESLCEKWIQLHSTDNPSKLVLLFFLREQQNKIDWQSTEIEFIHKTFYEYLAAAAILEILIKTHIDNAYFEKTFYLLSKSFLSGEILKFMFEMVKNEHQLNNNQSININFFSEIISKIVRENYNTFYPLEIVDNLKDKNLCEGVIYNSYTMLIKTYEENVRNLVELITKNEVNIKLNLANSNFKGVDILGWIFDNSMLQDSFFDHAKISGAFFCSCNLQHSSFESAIADRTHFNNADLYYTNFSFAQLATADFSNSVLLETNFEFAHLEGAYFCYTTLEDVNLSSAMLVSANFDDCIFKNVDFSNADLTNADLTNVKILCANWNNCIMENAKLSGVRLKNFDLNDNNIIEMLAEADLSNANWDEVTSEQKIHLGYNGFNHN